MPPLYGFWLFLKNNPVAQVVGAIVLFFVIKTGHAKYNQQVGKRRERERAIKQTRKIQTRIEEKSREKSAQVAAAAAAVQHSPTHDSLSDAVRRRFIRDREDSGTD